MVKHSERIEEGAGPLQCLRMAGAILRMAGEPLALECLSTGEVSCLDDSGNLAIAHWIRDTWRKGKGLALDPLAECGTFCPKQELVCLTSSGEIWVWKKGNSEPLWWNEDEAWITVAAGHPILPMLATGHENGMVQIWHAKTGEILFRFRDAIEKNETVENAGISALEWHPTDAKLMFADEQLGIRCLDVSAQKIAFELAGHKGRIVNLAWDPLGRFVFSAAWDGTVRVWDPGTGNPVILLNDHGPLVTAVSVSNDGRWLVAGDNLPSWNLWEVGAWRRVGGPVPLVSEPRFIEFMPGMEKLVFALADGRVIGLDPGLADKGTTQGRMKMEESPARGSLKHWVKEDWICLLPQGGAQYWQKCKPLVGENSSHLGLHLGDFKGPVRALDFSVQSGRLVTAHYRPGILRSWEVSQENEGLQCTMVSLQESVPGEGELLAMHPAGDLIVAGSQVSPDLAIFSLPLLTPKALLVEPLTENSIQDIQFSKNGSRLAVCGIGTLGKDLSQGGVILFDTGSWEIITRLDLGFWRLCWHPEDSRLALSGPDGSLMEWWPESGRCRRLQHVSEGPFSLLSYTPDGFYLAAASATKDVVIFDGLNSLPVGTVTLPGQIAAMGPGANVGEIGILLSGGDGWLLDVPGWLAEKNSSSQ